MCTSPLRGCKLRISEKPGDKLNGVKEHYKEGSEISDQFVNYYFHLCYQIHYKPILVHNESHFITEK